MITPIFKSGEIYNPSDYRGITVTSCLSKLFTLIINERLVSFINTKAILKPNQIGFRRKFRTSDHIFVLNTILNSYFANGKPVYSCFVDFSKAYDSVWRDRLVYKLILRKFSYRFISLISSMYHGLTSAVKLSNGITPFFESFVGLRQGCNLSPMLFNIFINDLTEIFDEKCCPVIIGNYNLNCLLYADDLLLLSETKNGLKECIARLGHYTKIWKLFVNLKKTKIMVFNKVGRIFDLRIPFEGKVIEPCSRYDYLGTTFTPSGSFSLGRKTLHKKASRAMSSFLSEINLRAGAQPLTIQKFFRALVRPILLYNCEMWGAFLK